MGQGWACLWACSLAHHWPGVCRSAGWRVGQTPARVAGLQVVKVAGLQVVKVAGLQVVKVGAIMFLKHVYELEFLQFCIKLFVERTYCTTLT